MRRRAARWLICATALRRGGSSVQDFSRGGEFVREFPCFAHAIATSRTAAHETATSASRPPGTAMTRWITAGTCLRRMTFRNMTDGLGRGRTDAQALMSLRCRHNDAAARSPERSHPGRPRPWDVAHLSPIAAYALRESLGWSERRRSKPSPGNSQANEP